MKVIVRKSRIPKSLPDYLFWNGRVESFLDRLKERYSGTQLFDLVITSPPYNIGKTYESTMGMDEYIDWQRLVIENTLPFIKKTGHVCWQIGSRVENNTVLPLDSIFIPLFKDFGLKLRNRIIWTFGHGLHEVKRFSGRYEILLWYTLGDNYTFNLDNIRIPQKYPGKKAYKGPNRGNYSGNPLGKNPTDVWDIPNVKANHVEKTDHPCQFPIGLVERCAKAFTNPGGTIFDPFAGVGSSGVAAALTGRRYIGCEIREDYTEIAVNRINSGLSGKARYRPHDKQIYNHLESNLSRDPEEFLE